MTASNTDIGISGFSLYVPSLRVPLERWCEWTGKPWDKISAVVGRSFRQLGHQESIYTMAASAVLRLIDQYDIDPNDVGYFGFGTESSTDNAAGAVIVRGMVDQALVMTGRSRISRACEVPEFKHACLGGVYAVKAAARYLACDGRGKKAIVVCGDVAEYERGSTGEQTQGAGAVAMLMEAAPKLCRLDLAHAGSSSDYRGLDFRKPVSRHFVASYAPQTERYADFPVFNGKYSTFCYLDAVTHAARHMFERMNGVDPRSYYREVAAVFMHRPYHAMPVSGLATMYVWSLAESARGRDELKALADVARVSYEAALQEIRDSRDLLGRALTSGIDADPYPSATAIVKAARAAEPLRTLLDEKMYLGSQMMGDLGNLYTAALPAWLAAGFEHALVERKAWAGQTILTVGYGCGDAAEVIPMQIVEGWEVAASKIGFARALEGGVDLTKEQYERRHDGLQVQLPTASTGAFVVERVGDRVSGAVLDIGIEYYRYVATPNGVRAQPDARGNATSNAGHAAAPFGATPASQQ